MRTLSTTTLGFLFLFATPVLAKGAPTYADPGAAVGALVTAARSGDAQAVVAALGERSRPILVSGDPVDDRAALKRFMELYDQSHSVESPSENSRTLLIGGNAWPFPIPLVKGKAGWTFDIAAGEKELLVRRVGGNELDTIQVCLGYVGAQEDYLARNPDGASLPHYADRLFSSPGKRDGLFWATESGEPESPMGPRISGAAREGYAVKPGKREPYHGYYFRMLEAQGPHAEGGAMSYREKKQLTLGYALVAYPASYASSGVMTFIVNQAGVVYQKDLGPKTASIAAAMKTFDPDASWTVVEKAVEP
ncbi:MAG TPA: DUF2950 domain-containing protein [Myxococcaceae bacterium]|nr:DUF2950 domain-containing protein [Myxococcaceae bacterium]